MEQKMVKLNSKKKSKSKRKYLQPQIRRLVINEFMLPPISNETLRSYYRSRLILAYSMDKRSKIIFYTALQRFYKRMKKFDPNFGNAFLTNNTINTSFMNFKIKVTPFKYHCNIVIYTNVYLLNEFIKQSFWFVNGLFSPLWIVHKLDSRRVVLQYDIPFTVLLESKLLNLKPEHLLLNEICVCLVKALKLI